jgi:hypothetical protein
VQDFVMLHVGYDAATTIETSARSPTMPRCGCSPADACPPASAPDHGRRRDRGGLIVAGGAVVPEGRSFAAASVIAGVPANAIA